MKIVTLNLNGIRAAAKRGIVSWLRDQDFDIACFQEIRADETQFDFDSLPFGYRYLSLASVKRGYGGVGIFSKIRADSESIGCGNEKIDSEGRVVSVTFGDLRVVSAYFPSGTSSDERLTKKFEFLDFARPYLNSFVEGKVVLCGDLNIAHNNIDLKNWKGNLRNSGFLPEERRWVTDFISDGWIDTWRSKNPEMAGFTWWSQRGQAYNNDVGWRIDYQFTRGIALNQVREIRIFRELRFSDHAALLNHYGF